MRIIFSKRSILRLIPFKYPYVTTWKVKFFVDDVDEAKKKQDRHMLMDSDIQGYR